jgi:hypothetical protein
MYDPIHAAGKWFGGLQSGETKTYLMFNLRNLRQCPAGGF